MVIHTGAAPANNDFPGFDYLFLINLTDQALTSPRLGAGAAGFLQNLITEGFSNDPAFGGGGPVTISQLGPYQVYGTTIPIGTSDFNASFTLNGVPFSITDASLSNNFPLYVQTKPTATTSQPTVQATERVAFSGPIASFNDPNVAATTNPASVYRVQIDWGDGSPWSVGTIDSSLPVGGPPVYTVSGTHTYADESNVPLPITVYVTDIDTDPDCGINLTNTATVSNPAVAATAVSFNAVEGLAFTNQAVATFTDPGGPEPLGDYSADHRLGRWQPSGCRHHHSCRKACSPSAANTPMRATRSTVKARE